MVDSLKGLNIGCLVDLHEHSIQTATRALKDGADDETVICGLLHDIGELMVPICHGEVGKSKLSQTMSSTLCGKGFNFRLLYFQSALLNSFINVHYVYFNESFKIWLKNFH